MIDPKPVVGDPAYDLAQLLSNLIWVIRDDPDPVAELRRIIAVLAARLDLDPSRVAGWALVKAFGWTWGPEWAHLIARAGGFIP